MRRLTSVVLLALVAGCESNPAEPVVPVDPDFSVLAGEWELVGRMLDGEEFSRVRGIVTLGGEVFGPATSQVDGWAVHTARLAVSYTGNDTTWAAGPGGGQRSITSLGSWSGGGSIDVAAWIPQAHRGPPLLYADLKLVRHRAHLYSTDLDPGLFVGELGAPSDTMGWQMRRR